MSRHWTSWQDLLAPLKVKSRSSFLRGAPAVMLDNTAEEVVPYSTSHFPSHQMGFRAYLGLVSFTIGVLGLTNPKAMFPGVPESEPIYGLAWLMVIGALAGIVDAIINDAMSSEYNWFTAARWRDTKCLAMAFSYLSLIYMAAKNGVPSVHDLFFGLNALAYIWVAVEDVRYRYVAPKLQPKG